MVSKSIQCNAIVIVVSWQAGLILLCRTPYICFHIHSKIKKDKLEFKLKWFTCYTYSKIVPWCFKQIWHPSSYWRASRVQTHILLCSYLPWIPLHYILEADYYDFSKTSIRVWIKHKCIKVVFSFPINSMINASYEGICVEFRRK